MKNRKCPRCGSEDTWYCVDGDLVFIICHWCKRTSGKFESAKDALKDWNK